MAERRFVALVLAGSRGPGDPVAQAAGVPHKALAPVAGMPMLQRVLDVLRASPSIRRIAVQTNEPAIVAGLPALRRAVDGGTIEILPTEASPARSVSAAIARLSGELPVLVTTADHALLTPAMVEQFCRDAADPAAGIGPSGGPGGGSCDIAVGLAPASIVLARYPGALRTFYKLGPERYSGCNLFALLTPDARQAIDFWVRLEQHRKKPWRLIAAIGIRPLLLYLTGRLDLARAMAELSRIVGVRGKAVLMEAPEAPIDVDKPEDLVLAEKIVAARSSLP
jgi:GTP:adenosylcobinamide-phosphate guanylyltransferase